MRVKPRPVCDFQVRSGGKPVKDFLSLAVLLFLEMATRNLELLRNGLLPMQRQSVEVARSGYLGGQIDFFNLTDAEQTLLRFGLDEVEARTQRELTLAELSSIVQGMPPSGGRTGFGAGAPRMGRIRSDASRSGG